MSWVTDIGQFSLSEQATSVASAPHSAGAVDNRASKPALEEADNGKARRES
eukprot:CAMPEP_0183315850 /NCGR_PEP_ID=MMETSP0160_2-20130417/53033_1 /TAXON_ID=2839 ORGANISM="Odontella Sinensis, Strain Grunow 1884" /NCGR_SAMPLE_ID=MMETSP0160_2 /ASSEMBLY_ACC=CAM_ASM_000250 /LENGTH=50 /DNA_ID=CAMNT_0025481517 /DNA_START=16 /DNA_END=165 /DNA_ORIENTATION=+